MTVQEEYFQNLSLVLKDKFNKKGFAFDSFSNKEEAKKFVLSLIKDDDVITFGGSTSVNQIGILEDLKSYKNFIDRNKKELKTEAEIKAFTTDEEQTNDYETLVLSELPAHKFWRSISTDLLIEVGCRVCRVKYENGLSEKFVYMPVIVDGDTKGYIKARMKKKEGKPSYVNLRGNWVSKFGLFPFDYAIQKMVNRTMVLVEGQRDALRLLSFGIPAMCIMGTQNWSADKARLLEMHGVDNIYIFMDGDDAGIHGTEKIWHTSHDLFNTKVIKLWEMQGSPWLKYKDLENPSKAAKENGEELYDPGNCPDVILHKLRNKIYKD